jgi:hypothetical protein
MLNIDIDVFKVVRHLCIKNKNIVFEEKHKVFVLEEF